MDEDRTADPARRGRLLSPTSGQPQTPPQTTTQPQLPMDLASQYQRRFAPSVFLPPMAPPRLMQPSSSGFSAFTNYQSLPATTTPAPGAGSHLARSLPKPPPFSVDYLGPLPYSTGPAAGAPVLPRSPPSPAAGGSEQQGPSASASASGLPPRGAGHRRSRSDFLVGFSRPNQLPALLMTTPAAGEYRPRDTSGGLEELFRSYRDPTNLVSSGGSGDTKNERNDHQSSSQRGWSPADSSDNEAESWAASVNGNADSSSANHPRHSRSLSVDSIMGNLNFGGMGGQVSLRLPPPPPVAGAGGNLTRTGSGGASSGSAVATASSELANGEFTESEMNKIMANGRLAEIAIADPKRVKRILANRISAAKSKERKVKYMGELERKVRVLQVETSTLSSKAASSQRECEALKTMNNEMKIRLQAMEQQAQLKDALNEALTSEVQRLKHIAGEVSDPHVPNGSHHHINRQILEQHLQQLQQKQPSDAQQQQQQQQESEQFKAQQKQWNH